MLLIWTHLSTHTSPPSHDFLMQHHSSSLGSISSASSDPQRHSEAPSVLLHQHNPASSRLQCFSSTTLSGTFMVSLQLQPLVTTALTFVTDNEHQYTFPLLRHPFTHQAQESTSWHLHRYVSSLYHPHILSFSPFKLTRAACAGAGEDWITNTVLYLTAATWYSTQPLPPATLITVLGPVSPALSVSPVRLKWTQHLNDTTHLEYWFTLSEFEAMENIMLHTYDIEIQTLCNDKGTPRFWIMFPHS